MHLTLLVQLHNTRTTVLCDDNSPIFNALSFLIIAKIIHKNELPDFVSGTVYDCRMLISLSWRSLSLSRSGCVRHRKWDGLMLEFYREWNEGFLSGPSPPFRSLKFLYFQNWMLQWVRSRFREAGRVGGGGSVAYIISSSQVASSPDLHIPYILHSPPKCVRTTFWCLSRWHS